MGTLIVLFAVAGLLAPAPSRAALAVCPPAEYVVDGAPIELGPAAGSATAVSVFRAPAAVAVAPACATDTVKVKARRRGTTLRATWRCEGLAKPLRLRGRIARDCATLTGKLTTKGLKSRRFVAQHVAPEGERFAGDPAAPVFPGIHDVDLAVPHPPSAIGIDADGRAVARRVIEVALADDATVGQANAVLDALGGGVVSAVAGVPLLVVRFPDPGSVDVLQQLVSLVTTLAGVGFAHVAFVPQLDVLPDNFSAPLSSTEAPRIDHQLAIRAAAAWNARGAMQAGAEPTVFVMDLFGNGVPDHVLSDFSAPDTDFTTGNPGEHGYHVFGIIAGSFGGTVTAQGQVTGVYPGTVRARAVDLQEFSGQTDFPTANNRAVQRIVATGGNTVLNTSLNHCATTSGATCGNAANAALEALAWIMRVRGAGLEGTLLHATSTGNASDSPVAPGGETNSAYSAAALLPGLTDGVAAVPNLTNTLVVDDVVVTATEPFAPECLNADSKIGGLVAAIGTDVFSFTDSIGAPANKSGTSMATPQVAGLAAYLWAIAPDLTAPQLAMLLRTTGQLVGLGTGPECHPAQAPGPVVDAYEAVLALDDDVLPEPTTAPVRRALLDLDDNGRFDDLDVAAWVAALIDPLTGDVIQPTTPDYGRHDLNGDGFTGTSHAERFDLDRVGSTRFGPADFGVAVQTIAGADVAFDEHQLTDLDVLCYYAHSDLFVSDAGTATRDAELGLGRCVRAAVDVLLPAQVVAGVATAVTIQVSSVASDGSLAPLPGAHVALVATGGTLGALTGVTDAQGLFATIVTAAPEASTLVVTAQALSAPGGDVLAQDDAQASVEPPVGSLTFSIQTTSAFADATYGGHLSDLAGQTDQDDFIRDEADSPNAVLGAEVLSPAGVARATLGSTANGNATLQTSGMDTVLTGLVTASADTDFAYAEATSGGIAGATATAQVAMNIVASDPNVDFGWEITGSVGSVLDPGHVDLAAGSVDTSSQGLVNADGGLAEADVFRSTGGSTEIPFSASGEGVGTLNLIVLAQASSTVNAGGPLAMNLLAQSSISFSLRLFPLGGATTTTTSTVTSTTASSTTTTVASTTTSTTLFVPGADRDPYRMYAATGPDAPQVSVLTQFVAETVDLGTAQFYLSPAGLDGALPSSQAAALACYAYAGAPFAGNASVVHRFGSDTLTLGDPFTLCVPSTPGGPIDHYVCHAASGGGLGGSHAIADEFQTQSVELGAPAAFCMPAGVDGAALLHPLAYVACYESTPAGAAGGVVPIGNAFHDTTLDVGLPNAVCIPALALVSRTP